MDYKYITVDDKFIDDPASPEYNTWITGDTQANSYESMLIPPYEIGLIINYNRSPVIPGAGSAIFLHIWKSPETPTAGCVALKKNMYQKSYIGLIKVSILIYIFHKGIVQRPLIGAANSIYEHSMVST